MKKYILSAALILASGCSMQPAFAQAKVPELSTAEKAAIFSIGEKLQHNADEKKGLLDTFAQIATEFAKAHPGFHLDQNTARVVADAPKAESKK